MIARSLMAAASVVLLAGCGADSMLQRKMGLTEAPAVENRVEQARAALQAGQVQQSIQTYEELVAAGGAQREEALYGLALARLQAGSGARSPAKARDALATLVKEYPQSPHRVEADILIGLIDSAGREGGQAAALKKSLAEKDRELASVREELEKKEEALDNLRKALLKR
jgi:hypothetical protein